MLLYKNIYINTVLISSNDKTLESAGAIKD
jgi:hypothetical protein